ncbi:MAG: low molecular weight phosphotyrosine protein phosphatase [Armatimonadetes bacterium]|nr:low molecular weight phosphotyrosine protein phosphatase [Anaerolineae bacterium]
MIQVLFVCLGNICRSPMAEAVFQAVVDEAGLTAQFHIDSAGTSGWHDGERAHSGTLDVLRRNGVDYHGRSRQLTLHDIETFDYLLAMDRSNLIDIHRMVGAVTPKAQLFLQYSHAAGMTPLTEVPDPYYTGGFDEVFELVLLGCTALLDYIRVTERI